MDAKIQRHNKRYIEVDILRGIAILMMIIYHFFWDLSFFYSFNITTPGWKSFQIATAFLFIFLVGVSLTLSLGNSKYSGKKDPPLREGDRKGRGWSPLFKKLLKRGAYIFSLGLLITVVTKFSDVGFIHFGILHFIGFSTVLSYPFLRFKKLNLLFSALFLLGGFFIKNINTQFFYPFVVLGVVPGDYSALDYYPIFPWFSIVLFGVFVGNTLYSSNGRKFSLSLDKEVSIYKILSYFGKHSLIIYLTHQPVLFGLLYIFL